MKYYTVYLRKTDELIAFGTAKECAAQLQKSINCFYSMVSKNTSGIRNKYEIYIDDVGDEEESGEEI